MVFIEGFIRSLETVLEPDQLEIIKKELLSGANELDDGEFRSLEVSPSAFGGAETASELGFHHGRAQQVIADTLSGVTADLRDFRDGVVKAQVMLEDADGGAQSDLARKEAAVAALQDANRSFSSDDKYHQARNEHGGNQYGGDQG